ncbi:unnamed protein product [Rhizophagus irregularis]|nr:unnamed protein product [Rhizophagus irregularis]
MDMNLLQIDAKTFYWDGLWCYAKKINKDSSRFQFKPDIFHPDYNLDENHKIQISEKKYIYLDQSGLIWIWVEALFVNRLWCRLAIPLLWENPFSIPTKNYRCIEIYLSYLNDDNKTKFNEYEIINNLLPSNTLLFNYPSFIKCLNLGTIYISTKEWVCTLLDDDRDKLEELVYRSLFEVFIKNEGILYSFEIVMFAGIEYFDTMELILQNPNLTYNIKNLTFNIYNISFHDIMNIIPFLKFLYSNCNSISSIILNFPIYNINNRSLIEKYLSQIIISQNNLKKISFESNTILYNPFLSLKNSNCSNTLNTIVFYYIDFNDIICIFNEVFNHLNVLESIHILYCHSINSNFIQQINKIIKPFKLKEFIYERNLTF